MAADPTEKKVLFQFPVGLRVLAVDHDPNILDVIQKMCSRCHYRAILFSDASLALNYLWEKIHCIDVILIEVHMPNVDTYEFLQHVTNETNVPVIMMSLDDDTSTVMKATRDGACDYWIKPLHENQFKIMWRHVAKRLWSVHNLLEKEDSGFVPSSSVPDTTVVGSNFEESDSAEVVDSYPPPETKPCIGWSQELHQQLLKAIMQIGLYKARPKKILAMMNAPGLTKEEVQSRLQRYRGQLLKTSNDGGTLQQSANALSESTESNDTVGPDTNHVPYSPLPTDEEVTSNLLVPKVEVE